ncbi:hypothetical protein CMO91_01100 [Candidatus Woesearchaeota archaeon]|nr:hypothetical protein [Candidatus Woesearchaeota archaeon]
MVAELLKEIGLTERESKVYLSLLDLGRSTTGPLIKASGVPNSKIYEILSSLHKKGLVTWVIGGKTKFFEAAEPKTLLRLFDQKRRTLANMLPELEARKSRAKSPQSVSLFEGFPAIRNLFIDLVSQAGNTTLYGITTADWIENQMVGDFYSWYANLKQEYNVTSRLLVSKKNWTAFKKRYHSMKALPYWEARPSRVSFPGDVGITGDDVLIINWDEVPTAILIQSKWLANQYMQFFKEAWSPS